MKLYSHQRKALRRVMKYDKYPLLMDPGTGKTLVGIKSMEKRYLAGKITRAVVFAPKTILFNWESEIHKFIQLNKDQYIVETLDQNKKDKKIEALEKFMKNDLQFCSLKELRAMGLKGTKKVILTTHNQRPKLQILVVNYNKVLKQKDIMFRTINKFKPQMAIIDEIHILRNRNAGISKGVKKITDIAKYRIAMTGTPVCNGYEDLFMQYMIIDPEIFGDHWKSFENQFIQKGGYMGKQIVGYHNEDQILEILRSNSFIITLEECIDLPQQLPDLNLHCELNTDAQRIYNEMANQMTAELEVLQNDNQYSRSELKKMLKRADVPYDPRESYFSLFTRASLFLNTMTAEIPITQGQRLQQLCGGFAVNAAGESINVSTDKLKALVNYMDGNKEPLIIFCKFINEVNMIHKELSSLKRTDIVKGRKVKRNLVVDMLMGKTKDKKKVNEDFQNGKTDILVLQIAAGSVGLNLQRASRVIFYSWSYSADEYKQAIGRIKRSGQSSKWQVVHIICKGKDSEILKIVQDKLIYDKKIKGVIK